ncbi:MAG: DUF1146 family protein [Erysipelotrichaceae bacterium]
MLYKLVNITVHLLCFVVSFYALSSLHFDRFCDVRKPMKVQVLLLLLAIGLGYVVAQFLLALTLYNGI